MAHCKKCKKSVGCSCNLKDGLCSYCYNATKQINNHASTSTDKLS